MRLAAQSSTRFPIYQFEVPSWFPLLEIAPALRNIRGPLLVVVGIVYAPIGGEDALLYAAI
jgi:hypothetical protein